MSQSVRLVFWCIVLIATTASALGDTVRFPPGTPVNWNNGRASVGVGSFGFARMGGLSINTLSGGGVLPGGLYLGGNPAYLMVGGTAGSAMGLHRIRAIETPGSLSAPSNLQLEVFASPSGGGPPVTARLAFDGDPTTYDTFDVSALDARFNNVSVAWMRLRSPNIPDAPELYAYIIDEFELTVEPACPVLLGTVVPALVCPGETATLSINAGGSLPLSYQWEADVGGLGSWTMLAEGANALTPGLLTADGTQTSTLLLTPGPAWSSPAVALRCVVSNSCGSMATAPFQVAVPQPPVPPVITTQPESGIACAFGTATFLCAASTEAMYQWRRNGLAIDEVANPTAATGELIVNGSEAGTYDCRVYVTSACSPAIAEALSLPATLSTCWADFDCSGIVSVQDIFDFLAAWFSADPQADINAQGGVGVQDIFDFIALWFAAC